jgi:hypothetical protein
MLTYAGTLSALSGLDLTAADRLGVLQARPKNGEFFFFLLPLL